MPIERLRKKPLAVGAALAWFCCAPWAWAVAIDPCHQKVYLTFNTGNMDNAVQVADVLQRHHVRATFFVSNLPTASGDSSLSYSWASWWKARAVDGHQFASLTYDHAVWRGDLPGKNPRFRIRLGAGAFEGREFTWDADKYCAQIEQAAQRLADFTGKKSLPLFRAPGGLVSPRLLGAASACGYTHVGWAANGDIGGELNLDRIGSATRVEQTLRGIRSGDILLATLGAPAGSDAWATQVLEPLIVGLRTLGFCFDTLRSHPDYQTWIANHGK